MKRTNFQNQMHQLLVQSVFIHRMTYVYMFQLYMLL